MKKMYLAIFLIILIVIVFAGCISFSNPIELTTIPHEDDIGDNQGNSQYPDSGNNGAATDPSSVLPDVNNPGAEATTAQNSTPGISVPASNEYDILRSGSFYMKGSLVDSAGVTSPMEVAITPDTIFMLSDFSGAKMGLLIADKTMYMIYEDKSAYLELSDAIMSMAGMDMDELMSADSINFSSYDDLSTANSVSEEDYNGHKCQVYHFKTENGGETRIFMDNTKLIRIATYTSSGKLNNSTEIEFVSGTVPANKCAPPSNYKQYKGVTGMFGFMTLLEDVVA